MARDQDEATDLINVYLRSHPPETVYDVKNDSTYSMGKAMVRVNMENAKIENIKTGDHALIIVDTVEGKSTLRSVMVHRAK